MTDSAENNIFLKIMKFSFGLGWFPHFKFFFQLWIKMQFKFYYFGIFRITKYNY